MFRSVAHRSLPKPMALVVSLLLALSFVPLGALTAWGAAGPSVDVYDQCQVGNPPVAGDACEAWTNGILNGTHNVYNEDDVTPQRLVMSFPTAGTQTVDLTYLTFDHGVHAYDSLATWNHTVTNADRCQSIGAAANCVGGAPNTFPIPLDSTVHHDVGVGESPIVSNHQLTGQVLTMYGGSLTGATYQGMGTYAPDYQTLRVTFTTTADAKVMLLFGGHIAATFGPRGWGEKADGTNLGAAQVPGGSYHIRVTAINGEAIGNRDNQLMSDAIAPPSETTISTNATAGPVTIGGSTTDTATVTPSNAVGTVDFAVYGPNDATCSGAVVFSSNNRPVVSGTATSAAFTPTTVGTYRWIASFTPTDPTKFDAVGGACNAANESSVVVKRQPAISTDSQDSATLPNASISDIATVTNLTSDASGTVTFNLYGPGDTTCATSIWSNEKAIGTVVSNSVAVNSDSHVVTQAGTYLWIANYSGDLKNEPVSGQCNDPKESTVVNKAPATITTDAQDTAKLPDATITDTATLTGVTSNAGGEIIFKLYGPDTSPLEPTCTEGDGGNLVFTSIAGAFPVSGPNTYGPASVEVDKAGVYFWVATYTGDDNNLGVSGVCGDPTETSDVDKASPTISTSATDGTLPGASIHDTATVKGLTSDATGTVAFSLWSNDSCTGTPIFTDTKPLGSVSTAGEAKVTSASFPVTAAGDYNWVAAYSGDDNNDTATGACGDTGETSTVNPATPGLSTSATNAQLPSGTIQDVATVSGLTSTATGTVTFDLWNNPTCVGDAVFSDSESLGTVTAGVAKVTSANYPPTAAGDYYWVASYSGDANNVAVAGECGDEGETSTVTKAEPDIATLAVLSATLPAETLSDTAILSGLTSGATGTVTFRLYGPDATPDTPTCDQGSLVHSSPLPIAIVNNGDGTASAESGDFTPTLAGTYFWVASYTGDANNADVSGSCGDTGETSVVNKAAPTIGTAATNAQLPDGQIQDVATVSGLTSTATGTVTFDLWNNPTCVGDAVFSDSESLGTVTAGVAKVTSANYPPTAAGDYYWIASYSGDANNLAVAGECGEEGETSTVTKADTAISTDAADEAPATQDGTGVVLTDTATLSGATEIAGGDITFTVYGPFDTLEDVSCDGEGTIVGEPVSVDGNGSYASDPVTVTGFGFYTWVAEYSGDANNEPADHACGLPEETVQFQPTLEKTADPGSGGVVQPDGSIEYTVTVGNTGDIAITGATVTDIVPPFVTVDEDSISDGGVFVAGSDSAVSAGTITWSVDLAAAGDEGDTVELTYTVAVDEDAPEGAVLVNRAVLFSLEDTTTHVVPTGDLTIVKQVSPVAGNGVVVHFGDTLTYTLNAVASGDLDQPSVVVTDYVPGFDPARPTSGKTTYVAGSAACVGAGDCTVTEPGADGLITWELGDMAAGTSRQVTFKVTIDRPAPRADGGITAVDVLNAGAVESTRTPRTPSNEVITPVTEVLGVKIPQPRQGSQLPRTGATIPPGQLAGVAISLLGLGLLLVMASGRRGRHRKA